MRSRPFMWIVLTLFCLPAGAAAQGGFDVGIPSPKAGPVDPAQSVAMPDLPGYEGMAAMNRHYAEAIGELSNEADMPMDPAYVEELQKQIQDLKGEQERALTDLQIEIALQNGDVHRALQLRETLHSLEGSGQMLQSPDPSEPAQRPEQSVTRRRVKNPDDE